MLKLIDSFYNRYKNEYPNITQKQKKDRTPEELMWLRFFKAYHKTHRMFENPLNSVRVKFFSYLKCLPLTRFKVVVFDNEKEYTQTHNDIVSQNAKKMYILYKDYVVAEVFLDNGNVVYRCNERKKDTDYQKLSKKEFKRIMNIRSPKWSV